MAYQRGDIIEIAFLIPHNNRTENHPAIIISNQMVYDSDGVYICVMVSHSDMNDGFSFTLTADMFVNPDTAPTGRAKAHLIAYITENHIIKNFRSNTARMKPLFVDRLVRFISAAALMEED